MLFTSSTHAGDQRRVHRNPLRRVLVVLGATALAGLGSCKPKAEPPAAAAPVPGDGRYPLTGTVVSVNADRGALLVDHDEIPGFMAAMTMEFKTGAGDIANARAGQRIRGVIYRAADGFHLEQVWPGDPANDRILDEAARTLRQDTVTRASGVYREVGERLPDFALYDQTGAVVQAARFRGRQIVLNFIFTRCPDAHMCPAATGRMIGLQRLAREAGVANFELVSISLDPEFDTPGVLREYAESRGIDTSNFSFLTGPERAIKDLLKQLGVETLLTGPLIKHTMTTVLIDETGRIVHRVDGSMWDPADFVSRLHRTPAAAGSPAS